MSLLAKTQEIVERKTAIESDIRKFINENFEERIYDFLSSIKTLDEGEIIDTDDFTRNFNYRNESSRIFFHRDIQFSKFEQPQYYWTLKNDLVVFTLNEKGIMDVDIDLSSVFSKTDFSYFSLFDALGKAMYSEEILLRRSLTAINESEFDKEFADNEMSLD